MIRKLNHNVFIYLLLIAIIVLKSTITKYNLLDLKKTRWNRLGKPILKTIKRNNKHPDSFPLTTTKVKSHCRNPVENCLEKLFTWHPSITSSRSMVSSDENIVSFGSQLLIKSTSGHTHSNTCLYSSEEYTIEIKYKRHTQIYSSKFRRIRLDRPVQLV